MPIKWKLFGLANYIMLAAYVFLLVNALRFTIEFLPAEVSLSSFTPFMLSLFVVVFNSVLNLYVFHTYLPSNPFSKKLRITYLISTILSVIAYPITIVSIFIFIYEILNSNPIDNFVYIILPVFLLILLSALFIFINQVILLRSIKKNNTG